MSIPRVYAAINAITADLAKRGLPKDRFNLDDQYQYRSIDDLYNRLAPLLSAHKLCILPRILERTVSERQDSADTVLINVCLRAAFDIVSVEDGSSHVIEAFGEALDGGDKATSKAMSSAYKHALIQTFCIPLCGSEDTERSSYRLRRHDAVGEPAIGWTRWAEDLRNRVLGCQTCAEMDHVQNGNRDLLACLSREQPNLYKTVGEAVATRRLQIEKPLPQNRAAGPSRAGKRKPSSERRKEAAIG